MSTIAQNLARIQSAKADIKSAIEAKGVTVPSSATIDTYDDYVSQISGGGGGGSSADTEALEGMIDRSITGITIPSGVTYIGDYAFATCMSLETVNSNTLGEANIPSGVIGIGSYAFNFCRSLTSVTIPDSVTSLGSYAFSYCDGLTSCTIGSGITSIGNYAFRSCTSLTSITVKATTPPTLGNSSVFLNTNDCPIYVPSGSVSAYQSAWSDYSSRIQAIPNS